MESTPLKRPSMIGPMAMGIVIGLVIGIGGYYAWNHRTITSTVSTSSTAATPTTTATSATTAASLNTYPATWKTASITELNRQLNYPSDWKMLAFAKKTEVNELSGGTWFYATYAGINPSPTQLGFSIMAKDYKQDALSFNPTSSIDPNWTKTQFATAANIDQNNLLYYQKISDKAVLAMPYSAPECSPNTQIRVYSPFVTDYPNLDISIPYDFSNNSALKTYEQKQQTAGQPSCDEQSIYKSIVDGWIQNGFPADLQANIDIARQIANSIRPITQ